MNPPPPDPNMFPPEGLYVPDVFPVPATVPADPVEKDLTNALEEFTEEIVTLPAEDAEPLCIDLIGEELIGYILEPIMHTPLLPNGKRLLL